MNVVRRSIAAVVVVALALAGAACSSDSGDLTVYSGRTEDLIGPLLRRFEEETGVKVRVRYGDSAEVAGAILEEGDKPRADVLLVQDAGNIGQVAKAGRLAALDRAVINKVPTQFRSPEALWVGLSGRARVVVYNTEKVPEAELPAGVTGFTDPRWKDRLAWAPTNGSFQAFVTAFRVMEGEDAARRWLEGVKANNPRTFPNNSAIVEAVGRGEVDAGFVNHYYLPRLRAEGRAGKAANKVFGNGDPGSLVNVAAAGIVKGGSHTADARRLVEFLLGDESQRYFAERTYELPVVPTVAADASLPAITSLPPPEVDLSKLDDAKGTIDLLTRLGIL
ncbi:MAG TPA: iron ABC transporter substrate-binding protein [Acidimicrobiales bacterium]|nr:iron ABC transporter substrate-binding protein [Acidimicrobiales bacterium]